MEEKTKTDKKIDSASKKIQELETKIKELTTGWQRTQADFENYRKRAEGLKTEWLKMANAGLIIELLPVLDNFRRASQHTPDNLKNDNWIIGIQQIEKQLETILAQIGLNKIEVRPGDKFDPALHEAISHETDRRIPADNVIEVAEEGYKLADKVLKAVKVRVSKGA